jgi:hypothetical protein
VRYFTVPGAVVPEGAVAPPLVPAPAPVPVEPPTDPVVPPLPTVPLELPPMPVLAPVLPPLLPVLPLPTDERWSRRHCSFSEPLRSSQRCEPDDTDGVLAEPELVLEPLVPGVMPLPLEPVLLPAPVLLPTPALPDAPPDVLPDVCATVTLARPKRAAATAAPRIFIFIVSLLKDMEKGTCCEV